MSPLLVHQSQQAGNTCRDPHHPRVDKIGKLLVLVLLVEGVEEGSALGPLDGMELCRLKEVAWNMDCSEQGQWRCLKVGVTLGTMIEGSFDGKRFVLA